MFSREVLVVLDEKFLLQERVSSNMVKNECLDRKSICS